jgi:hypothetical protein
MEDEIAQLKLSGLELKLSNEKLYIQTSVSQETIALRSIFGIGVVDLVEIYNEELNAYNAKKRQAKVGLVFFWVFLFLALSSLIIIHPIVALFIFIPAISGLITFMKLRDNKEPSLMSAVRIMITGTHRDFSFDKGEPNAVNVAKFVAQVENTLSAYHKD